MLLHKKDVIMFSRIIKEKVMTGERENMAEKKKDKTAKPEREQKKKKASTKIKLPGIFTENLFVFPGISATFDITRESQKEALVESVKKNNLLFLGIPKKGKRQPKRLADIHNVGSIVKVRQMSELISGNGYKVTVEGIERGRTEKITGEKPFIFIEVNKVKSNGKEDKPFVEALRRDLLKTIENFARASGKIQPETVDMIRETGSLELVTDITTFGFIDNKDAKNHLLQTTDPSERAEYIKEYLERETDILQLEQTLAEKVKSGIDRSQKEYFLREQMNVIKKELGEKFDIGEESKKYYEQLEKLELEEDTRTKIEKEIKRLDFHHSGSPEISQIRNYLDLVFELPWGKVTKDNLSISKAKAILDREHYGMEKVKERITEFIAVRKLKSENNILNIKGPIMCLVGPPGVGKTSIAKSLAHALNRKYIRMSLGGVHDESEIRGHRRTYIGSLPGRFINAIRQTKTDNPLILLDEVDKLGRDFRGDPSSALLEVLDPEQNNNFRDNYLEVPYDLSKVLFITTANNWENIPAALYDRMEIVILSGYTREEKEEIAVRHIIPKQLEENGIKKGRLIFTRGSLRKIIQNYTAEAGVRELERMISKICRKAAIEYTEKNTKKITVKKDNVEKFLGKKKKRDGFSFSENLVGVANGLAWTSIGGNLLPIEVSIHDGKGNIELTGQLGNVMKESARLAYSFVKSNATLLGLDPLFYVDKDIHIHVPSGATQKEGPSAGVALTMALISAYTKKSLNNKTAMTGEITLRGKILAVGGIKEKLIAASRFKIKKVYIPHENEEDTDDLPESVKKTVEIVPVKTVYEIIKDNITPGTKKGKK